MGQSGTRLTPEEWNIQPNNVYLNFGTCYLDAMHAQTFQSHNFSYHGNKLLVYNGAYSTNVPRNRPVRRPVIPASLLILAL